MPEPPIPVHSFGVPWGMPLPTASPFGIKLVTWMSMHDVPYQVHVQNNPGKGPKGKCPWIVLDGEAIGDSQLIIETLRRTRGIAADSLSAEQVGVALSTRLMLEEHYHQIWEHELFIHPVGWETGAEFFDQLPPGVRVLVRTIARRQMRQQLVARGVGRHDPAQIVQMGIQVLDAVDALLGDTPFFFGPEPTDVDATVFGFLAVTRWIPARSPVWEHFESRPRLGEYCDRVLARYFNG